MGRPLRTSLRSNTYRQNEEQQQLLQKQQQQQQLELEQQIQKQATEQESTTHEQQGDELNGFDQHVELSPPSLVVTASTKTSVCPAKTQQNDHNDVDPNLRLPSMIGSTVDHEIQQQPVFVSPPLPLQPPAATITTRQGLEKKLAHVGQPNTTSSTSTTSQTPPKYYQAPQHGYRPSYENSNNNSGVFHTKQIDNNSNNNTKTMTSQQQPKNQNYNNGIGMSNNIHNNTNSKNHTTSHYDPVGTTTTVSREQLGLGQYQHEHDSQRSNLIHEPHNSPTTRTTTKEQELLFTPPPKQVFVQSSIQHHEESNNGKQQQQRHSQTTSIEAVRVTSTNCLYHPTTSTHVVWNMNAQQQQQPPLQQIFDDPMSCSNLQTSFSSVTTSGTHQGQQQQQVAPPVTSIAVATPSPVQVQPTTLQHQHRAVTISTTPIPNYHRHYDNGVNVSNHNHIILPNHMSSSTSTTCPPQQLQYPLQNGRSTPNLRSMGVSSNHSSTGNFGWPYEYNNNNGNDRYVTPPPPQPFSYNHTNSCRSMGGGGNGSSLYNHNHNNHSMMSRSISTSSAVSLGGCGGSVSSYHSSTTQRSAARRYRRTSAATKPPTCPTSSTKQQLPVSVRFQEFFNRTIHQVLPTRMRSMNHMNHSTQVTMSRSPSSASFMSISGHNGPIGTTTMHGSTIMMTTKTNAGGFPKLLKILFGIIFFDFVILTIYRTDSNTINRDESKQSLFPHPFNMNNQNSGRILSNTAKSNNNNIIIVGSDPSKNQPDNDNGPFVLFGSGSSMISDTSKKDITHTNKHYTIDEILKIKMDGSHDTTTTTISSNMNNNNNLSSDNIIMINQQREMEPHQQTKESAAQSALYRSHQIQRVLPTSTTSWSQYGVTINSPHVTVNKQQFNTGGGIQNGKISSNVIHNDNKYNNMNNDGSQFLVTRHVPVQQEKQNNKTNNMIPSKMYFDKPTITKNTNFVQPNSQQAAVPLLYKGTTHKFDDGNDNVLLVIISDRIDGVIPSLASIIHHSSKKVDVVLIGDHAINDKVHAHFGSRINQFISMTVPEVQADLNRNGIQPIWTWPEWHTSVNNPSWKNENTVHVADWDSLPTHSHELNHLRFYLPYVSIFANKGYFYFLDDDILVHKDLGPVAADVMRDLPSKKGIITPCNIWIWNSECHHFDFHDQKDYIWTMPSLYGDRKVCKSEVETHCFPSNYMQFIESVLPPDGKDQKAWNFGFSLFALDNWRQLELTKRYEKVMKESYRLHVFPETSLTFGLGVPYIAFAGAVECWNENKMTVRDGFGFIEWNRYEMTFGKGFYDNVDVVHFTGPNKPWENQSAIEVKSLQPYLEIMAKEKLPVPQQLEVEPSKNVFTLLASDRTGAQWIMNTLDSHPQVCASGESSKPETGFSSDILLPTGLPWYPSCSIKRGCTYAFIEEAVIELTKELTNQHNTPPRCKADYDPFTNKDPYGDHLERLCTFVTQLQGNWTKAAIGRLWVDAFISEDKNLIGCSCSRGTQAKGLKVEPEWLVYQNFPDENKGSPQLVLDDSKLHGSKVIRLKRRNMWARYKSMVMAQQSGQYHIQTPEEKQEQESHAKKAQISVEDLELTINRMVNIDKFGDEWAMRHASEVLWIDYEDCRDNTAACFKQIFDFLGVDAKYVDSKGKKFESSFADLNLDSSLDYVKNKGAVQEALAVNGWGHFVDLENFHPIQLLIHEKSATIAKMHQTKGINTTLYGDYSTYGQHNKFAAAIPILSSIPPATLVVISNDRNVQVDFPTGHDGLRYDAIAAFRKAFIELTEDHPSAIIVSGESECCTSALTHSRPGDYFNQYNKRIGRACSSGAADCQWEGDEKTHVWRSFMRDLATKRNAKDTDQVYLDAGLIAGKAGDLLQLIHYLAISPGEDDRAVLTDFMFRNPDKILIDYNQRLFGIGRGEPKPQNGGMNCILGTDVTANSRRLSISDTNALFIHSPREVGCRQNTLLPKQRFPRWGPEGIQIQGVLDHFERVIGSTQSIVGTEIASHQGPEIPYVVDNAGIFASSIVRNRTEETTFQWRLRPTEALVKLAYTIVKKANREDEKSRWQNILTVIGSGGSFPYWAWYGDYKSCNKNNLGADSIPLFTAAAKSDCYYAFPIPNYMTIIDTQRTSDHWQGVFEQFKTKYPVQDKIRKAVWRGSFAVQDSFSHIRWRFAKSVHDLQSDLYDVGITSITNDMRDNRHVDPSEVGGLVESISPMMEFMKYRVIMDMDGDSWSSRFGSLLCMNSVVIKIEPAFVEYYFSDLIPWTHYIPVKNDLSDLHTNVQWALNPENDKIVEGIISSANQFCSQRLTPANLAHDLLDVWESYIIMLTKGDPNWLQKWMGKKNELFSPSSKAQMILI